jgi:hypothetical protein
LRTNKATSVEIALQFLRDINEAETLNVNVKSVAIKRVSSIGQRLAMNASFYGKFVIGMP